MTFTRALHFSLMMARRAYRGIAALLSQCIQRFTWRDFVIRPQEGKQISFLAPTTKLDEANLTSSGRIGARKQPSKAIRTGHGEAARMRSSHEGFYSREMECAVESVRSSSYPTSVS